MERTDEKLYRSHRSLVEGMGFVLVDVGRGVEHGRRIFRFYIDADGGVSLEDCERSAGSSPTCWTRRPELASGYVLEVSSPGLDHRLKKEREYAHFAGREARLVLREHHRGPECDRGRDRGRRGWRRSHRAHGRRGAVHTSYGHSPGAVGFLIADGAGSDGAAERTARYRSGARRRLDEHGSTGGAAENRAREAAGRSLLVEALEAGLLSAARKKYGPTAEIEVIVDERERRAGVFLTRPSWTTPEDESSRSTSTRRRS